MSINAVAPSPSPLTLLPQFTSPSGSQHSTPPAPSTASAASADSSLATPVGSFSFTINGENYSATISSGGGEYTAAVPWQGTISGPSEASVEAAINVRLSEMA